MSKKIAFLFPGQGAQYSSMGRDFFEHFESAKKVFKQADEVLGRSFSSLIFSGSSNELTLTKNSQPAIFVVSIAILRVVQEENPGLVPFVCAGLSLGEYSALVAAEKISFEEGLSLVQARANFMHKACETHPGTMHVVLGLDLSAVEEVLLGNEEVWVANLNCPGQIVIAGTKKGIEKVAPLLIKDKGARRVMPLEVSGAFHSGLMQEAQDKLEPFIQSTSLEDSTCHIVMNVTGNFTSSLKEIRSNMIKQVTQPVLWQKGIQAMVEKGVVLFIEIGPGKSLAGMIKRMGLNVSVFSIEKVEDLKEMQGVEHAQTAQK